MSRSPQGSSACKLPFKCCYFVVSQFIYLFTNLWNNQKPPPTCYTTSVVGLLPSMVLVILLGLSQRKILPQNQLGPCIKYLALLLHCSHAGALFIFIRNHLLQHPWTLDLLLLYPALLLWHITRIRDAICTLRHTIASLGRVPTAHTVHASHATRVSRCSYPPARSSMAPLVSAPREGSPLPL